MVTYETAYREAYKEIMDFLMSIMEEMYDNDPPCEGDVNNAAEDATRDAWRAIHGMDSGFTLLPDREGWRHDPYWSQIIFNVARSRVASI
jgi:hypothetical protein